jgi:hypothetical protein
VGYTEGHHFVVLFVLKVQQAADVESDYSHQLVDILVLFALEPKLVSEGFAQSFVGNCDGLLQLFFNDIF